MAKFMVQRQVTAWEEVVVEADSFDEAQDKAIWDVHPSEWVFLGDDMAKTNNFFIEDLETGATASYA